MGNPGHPKLSLIAEGDGMGKSMIGAIPVRSGFVDPGSIPLAGNGDFLITGHSQTVWKDEVRLEQFGPNG